eukprot:2050996-Prymnesium_polylepis.1
MRAKGLMAGGRGLGRARVRNRRCAAAGVAAAPRRRQTCGDLARRSLACLAISSKQREPYHFNRRARRRCRQRC